MRRALILLLVVAGIILAVAAVNHAVAFDIDYVVGTVTAVSLFWVGVALAALVFIIGAVAAWLAQAGAVATQRRLEKELEGTYTRLRAAEARLRKAPAEETAAEEPPPAAAAVAPGEQADDEDSPPPADG